MKKILIQTVNDRGNETRISTNKDKMELTLFYQDAIGEIRSFQAIIKIEGNELVIAANSINQFKMQGEKAEKLTISK